MEKEKRAMEKIFIETLKKYDIYHAFIREFGKEWRANDRYKDGWWFDEDSFSYRACDLFLNHRDGDDWRFDDDDFERQMVKIFKGEGFEMTHNSGDEEDGFFRMEKKVALTLESLRPTIEGKITAHMHDLDEETQNLVNENFWDLI